MVWAEHGNAIAKEISTDAKIRMFLSTCRRDNNSQAA